MYALAPGLGAVTKKASRRLMAFVTAGALVLASLGATATPARSDTTDDLLRLFLGIAAVAVIISAIDENRTPRHVGRYILPDDCRETVRIRGRHVETYNARCLEWAGYRDLPQYCRLAMRTDRGQRPSYLAQCLYDAGYRPEQRSIRPDRPYPRHGTWLPRECEMAYRERGQRVSGYDGQCLSRYGFHNLPRQCRVSDRSGRHYFNASCLIDMGYRRPRY